GHRGPDGQGIWQEGSVGLGHGMLHTTPESLKEKLPLTNCTGELVITADARIDNRDELIETLNLSDRPHHQIVDSQLILTAYERWGESCPQKLIGDFAFVIWDGQKQQLFCARDHMGVKPFYYYHKPGQIFVCTSEIKALVCLPEVPCQLNEIRIADHLVSMFEDKVITYYQDILRLPPAHSLIIRDQTFHLQPYWTLNPTYELRLSSDEAYVGAFRDIFFEAVRCRLRSAFPVGSTLSGGLDSSSVTCVARELLIQEKNTPLHTFSYIFDKVTECDERSYISTVLAKEGYIPHFMPGDQLSPLIDADRAFWHLEGASIGAAMYLPWYLCQTAQQVGVRNFLTGFDGDTAISHGVTYLVELALAGQWSNFFVEAEALSEHFDFTPHDILKTCGLPSLQGLARRRQWANFIRGMGEISRHSNLSRLHLFLNHGLKPLMPKPVRRVWRRFRGPIETSPKINVIIKPEFAERIDLRTRLKRLNRLRSSSPSTLREQHWRDLTTGTVPLNFELYDQTAAAFGVEARHPFMDKRLLEFCLALPPNQKLRQGWTRWILHQAMATTLPEPVRLRHNKTDLGPNFVHGLLTFERETLDEVLLTDSSRIEKYVEIKTLRKIYQRLLSQKEGADKDIMDIWGAVTLALWLRYSRAGSLVPMGGTGSRTTP
ncbi:MAG: lasso peptide isopeptide bond-forming cyclase, partial [Nitrospira sp.]|nr:lasso peptide isopeptide bond-forming cyclase [Nitrospira sp.]